MNLTHKEFVSVISAIHMFNSVILLLPHHKICWPPVDRLKKYRLQAGSIDRTVQLLRLDHSDRKHMDINHLVVITCNTTQLICVIQLKECIFLLDDFYEVIYNHVLENEVSMNIISLFWDKVFQCASYSRFCLYVVDYVWPAVNCAKFDSTSRTVPFARDLEQNVTL